MKEMLYEVRCLKSKEAATLFECYNQFMTNIVHQSDRGTEFEGKLLSMCESYKIRMIKLRPYHPQSQGKVERSHRSLRKKIIYDFINLGKKGLNWTSNLASQSHILNAESKEELGWKSPFEVYFGRKSNILVTALLENVADFNDCIIKAPKRKDYRRHFRNVKKLRQTAQLYSKRMNERMVRCHARLHKIPAYKRGDEVLVHYRPDRRGSITPKGRIVLKGTVLKKSKTNSMFKVRMVPPG